MPVDDPLEPSMSSTAARPPRSLLADRSVRTKVLSALGALGLVTVAVSAGSLTALHEGTVRSEPFTPRTAVLDARDDGEIGWVDDLNSFSVWLSPYSGLFLLLREPASPEDDLRRSGR